CATREPPAGSIYWYFGVW
nr:immunoglobulin heavy chain junction region [Mus musculus]